MVGTVRPPKLRNRNLCTVGTSIAILGRESHWTRCVLVRSPQIISATLFSCAPELQQSFKSQRLQDANRKRSCCIHNRSVFVPPRSRLHGTMQQRPERSVILSKRPSNQNPVNARSSCTRSAFSLSFAEAHVQELSQSCVHCLGTQSLGHPLRQSSEAHLLGPLSLL